MSTTTTPALTTASSPVSTQLEQYCKAQLIEQTKRLGNDHPDLVKPLSAMALVYQHMEKDYGKAMECHNESMRILTKALHEDRNKGSEEMVQLLATTLTDMGILLESNANYGDAHERYTKAQVLLRSIDQSEFNPVVIASSRGASRSSRGFD